jgi:branched-chain amino acid transport system ATP-binding protein
MLELRDLDAGYGPLQVLRSVGVEVQSGELFCIVGANGAGKTTLLRAIMGLCNIIRGDILLDSVSIRRKSPAEIARMGIALVPEGRRLFPGLTVRENLLVAARWSNRKSEREESLARVRELFPRLKDRWNQNAWTLSGGEQQMVAIGRAIMARPQIMMLDEPSMGLAPLLTKEMFSALHQINAEGTTMLLVEQNARQSLAVSTHAAVLENGAVVEAGRPADLAKSSALARAYLGDA